MARAPRSSIRAAARKKHAQALLRRQNQPRPRPRPRPRLRRKGWTGVRGRVPHRRWAAEICVPGTRTKLWIGRFEKPVQAALAYDAALFCFHGQHRMPRPSRFNFPLAARPDGITEDVRAALTIHDVKRVAATHARSLTKSGRFDSAVVPVRARARARARAAKPLPPPPPPPPAPAVVVVVEDAASAVAGGVADDDGSTSTGYSYCNGHNINMA